MIPIRLTLQGIYSYQDKPQTIEFGPLLDAGLFGIFGAVGSGKSSILEAISMALYGEIERLNKRDDRNYNMMNLKSNRLYIDFEFSNYMGRRFRFECEGRRNRKQYNEVNTYRRLASEWKDDEWHPLDHTNGEMVTGLSYENFKRTVIIPQGRFQEFLELTPGGRSQMLQDLFSLERFDLAGSTAKLSNQNSDAIHHLQGRLTGYDEVTPEMLKNSREQLTRLKKLVEQRTKDRDKLRKSADDSTKLKELFDQQTDRLKAWQKMKETEPAMRSAERQLRKYQEARHDFSTRLEQIDSKQASVSQLETTLHEKIAKEKEVRSAKEDITKKHLILQKTTDGHAAKRKKAEEADIAGKLRSVLESRERRKQRITNGMSTVLELQNQIEKKERELENMEVELTGTRAGIQDRELLLELRNAFARKADLSSQIDKINRKIEGDRRSILQDKSLFLKENDLPSSIDDELKIHSHLESRLRKGKATLEDYRIKWHHLKVQAEMAGYVEQLSPGESCPLCGSTEHPAPAHFEETSQQIGQIKGEVEQLESEQKRLDKAKLKWENLKKVEEQIAQNKELQLKEIKALQVSLHPVEKFLEKNSNDFPNAGNVEKGLEASAKMLKSLKSAEEQIRNLQKEMRNEKGDLEKYREKISQLRSEFDQLKGEVNSLESSLSEATLVQLNEHLSEEWTVIAEEINRKIGQEKEEYRVINEERERVIKQYTELKTSINTTKDYCDKEKSELQSQKEKLNIIFSQSGFESLDEVRKILKKELDVDKEQNRIKAHDREIHLIEDRLKDLKRQIGDRQFDGNTHDQLIRKYEESEKELLELREQWNYISKKLEESQKRMAEKEKLAEELSGLELRAENLKVLEGLFRGKGFVDYVSTIYLREICGIANRRFRKLTNNHFSLVLSDDNQFNVRDYLHDGQIRSVKTLSGGQTFQVSLCLALALAESLQSQSKSSQNFFFLDEGFGTLDGDALRLVLESLKSLRQEGRVVGVISHVESLQDEMDMYLHILNDTEKGSQIEKSWEFDS